MGSYYRVRGQLPPLTTLEAATQTPASRLTASGGGSLTALAPEWNALADAVGAPPFLRPGWFDAWTAAFGPRDLELVGVRSDDGLAGVVPLVRRATFLRAPANAHTPLFGAVVADDGAAGRLAEELVERRRCIDLPLVDPKAETVAALRRTASAAGFNVLEQAPLRQPYLHLDGLWSDYEATLPRDLRREGARLRRRLEELGTVTFEYGDGGDDLEATLTEGFAIEGSGWKSARGTAIASSPRVEGFYRNVARWAARHGWLRLAFLRLDGRAVAFDLCLEAAGVVYALKGGFDPDFRRFGPGVLLLRDTLRHAFDRGLSRYEFLGTDDGYKLAWTDTAHERVRFQLYPPTATGAARLLAERSGRPLAKRVKRVLRPPRHAPARTA